MILNMSRYFGTFLDVTHFILNYLVIIHIQIKCGIDSTNANDTYFLVKSKQIKHYFNSAQKVFGLMHRYYLSECTLTKCQI